MGQQCCSDDNADRQAYNNTIKVSDLRRPELKIKSTSEDDFDTITNFAIVQKIPKLHPLLAQIQQKLHPFKPTADFIPTEGVKQANAYAINNNGLIYDRDSQWKDGLPHGKGRLIYPDGSLYTGYFYNGLPNGQGRFISAIGWYYQGQLVKQQAEGKGIFVYEALGYHYDGEWSGDLPNGKGKQTWSKPGKLSTYEGQFVGGKKNGKGKYICSEDWEYEGNFSNNQITGSKGLIKYKNGQIYEGDFLQGKKHGFGTYKWPDGSTYEGWYSHDKKDGHGKFRSSDNKIFQGEWRSGKREGRGVLIVGGKKFPGEWVSDLPASNKYV